MTIQVDGDEISQLLQEIKEYGIEFNNLIKNENKEDVQHAYIFSLPKEKWDIPAYEYKPFETITFSRLLTDNDREIYKKIAKLQKILSNKIINLYIIKLEMQGISIPKSILEEAGFRLCSKCRQLEMIAKV